MLNKKFVTPFGSGVRLTLALVGGLGLWESLEWSGDCFSLGVGAMWGVVFHVEL